jgi:hypothetical protein
MDSTLSPEERATLARRFALTAWEGELRLAAIHALDALTLGPLAYRLKYGHACHRSAVAQELRAALGRLEATGVPPVRRRGQGG